MMKVYAKDVKGGRRITAKISKTLGLVVITAGGGTTSCVLASVRSLKNIGAVLIVRSNQLHCLPKVPLLYTYLWSIFMLLCHLYPSESK